MSGKVCRDCLDTSPSLYIGVLESVVQCVPIVQYPVTIVQYPHYHCSFRLCRYGKGVWVCLGKRGARLLLGKWGEGVCLGNERGYRC